ncbi:MAG: alkaline phosphatase, partial [Bacteroidetes bacterium]|nr:alkaline phosphatase [Bacteroidota bacterium]
MKNTFLALLIFSFIRLSAQPFNYSVANAHSHNDYNNPIPFYAAYTEGFGSIEADILLQDGILYVGHSTDDIKYKRTLEDYYIKPLLAGVRKNNGFPYADGSKSLQLLIDIKTGAIPTLDTLISLLKKYPELINTDKIKWVISGNRPDASKFSSYPSFIWFDGNIEDSYSNEALSKIVMLSADLKNYTEWNGKSNTTSESEQKIKAAVAKVHGLNKLIRFWDAPDIINTWYELMHFGVDYINTDHIHELASFLNKLPRNSFVSKETYTAYQPTYKSDGSTKKVKNIILLIGDGTSLAQLYAGYTANKGALNLFQMMNIGLSKTSSYDNYITDSAPGSTAISSGIKTNNRFVGVDHTGKAVPLIPLFAAKRKIKTGIITCGDIADATPADFYAHQSSRDDATAILKDLLKSPIDILMGSGDESLNNVGILKESDKSKIGEDIVSELRTKYKLVSSIDSVKENTKDKWIVIEKKAGLSILDGRGNWMQQAFA